MEWLRVTGVGGWLVRGSESLDYYIILQTRHSQSF